MTVLQEFIATGLKQPIPLDYYLLHHQKGFKKQKVSLLMHKKWVLVNGQPADETTLVNNGDEIQITSPYTTHLKIFPENIPLDIIKETEDWIVINKPSGMACHGGLGSYWGTLLNALAFHYENTGQTVELQNGLVHRLDKQTSGLIVVAKTIKGRELLLPQFRNKTAKRLYTALVHGIVKQGTGTIAVNIGRNPQRHLDIRAFPDGDLGKPAVTHYRVLERATDTTLLECELETGRTNQIRIHLQYIGHSIVGDKRYPPPGAGITAPRLMLHAHYLEFWDQELMQFTTPAGFAADRDF